MKREGEPTRFFSIPNWEEYQHYKDRDPPWIKLHTKILESYELSLLPDAAKAHLMLIWLLASRLNNRIPLDADWIGKQISANEPVDLELLAEAGFICEAAEEDTERVRWPSRHISEKLRSKLLRSAAGVCTACGEKSENLEIDHIVPVSKGGESVDGNLQVLCRSCNRRKRTSTGLRSNLLRSDTALRSLETEAERETKTETEREHARTREAPLDNFQAHFDPRFKNFMKELEQAYPEHAGRSNWRKAGEGVVALLGRGYSYDAIRAAVGRKRAFHEAKGDVGTEFVMNPGNFFADPENIDNEWKPPASQQKPTRLEETADYNWETLQSLEKRRGAHEPGRQAGVRRLNSHGGDAPQAQAASQ